jgi:hypothetical protein
VKYKVSAKTIRDIWNRKTWTFATYRLWKGDEMIPSNFPSDQVIFFQFLVKFKTMFLTTRLLQDNNEQIYSGHMTKAYDIHPYKATATVNEKRMGNIDVGMTSRFYSHQRAQEPRGMTFSEIKMQKNEQTGAASSFLSVIEDVDFLQSSTTSSTGTSSRSFSISAAEFDPFYSDWPHWEEKIGHRPNFECFGCESPRQVVNRNSIA